jgi:lysyl-tRNA synthetase class 2
LAQLSKEDYRVAQRFELFIAGIELANGYHELLEATELSSRNQIVNQQRLRDGKVALPAESRLLDAMRSGLPACSGCALGLDRLLMVISQAQRIDQVIAFPIELA